MRDRPMDFEKLLEESMDRDTPVQVACFVMEKAIALSGNESAQNDALIQRLREAVESLSTDGELALGYVLDQRIFAAQGQGAFSGLVPLETRLTIVEAHIIQNALIDAGIDASIRGQHISAADVLHPSHGAGIWIKPKHLNQGRALLEHLRNQADTQRECPQCSEKSPAHFGTCWNCSTPLSPVSPVED